MEQIVFFLTEYANGISLTVYGVTLILLLVTLHRIKQIKKQIQKLAATGERAKAPALPECTGMESASGREPEPVALIAEQQKPEELIDAVLGEVFP